MNLNHAYALVFILFGVLGVSIIVHNVEAAPPPTFLYIRADGSIDPPAQPYIESLTTSLIHSRPICTLQLRLKEAT